MNKHPRIAYFDIETAPNVGYSWGKYEQNIIAFVHDWYLLSFAVRWEGQKRVKTFALPDYAHYKKHKDDDRELVRELWRMMNKADVIIAHNGDAFDIKKANARFIKHGLNPPAPYKSIDTLKIARRNFQFDGNKLNDLAHFFGIGSKLPHTGFDLWKGCMAGDARSWALMRKYNAHDVVLLEAVYKRMAPWHSTHPNLTLYDGIKGCPTCRSTRIYKRGRRFGSSRIYQQYTCRKCGRWFAGEVIKLIS